MFSEPALTRPTARSTGAKSSVSASIADRGGTISCPDVVERAAELARREGELGREAETVA